MDNKRIERIQQRIRDIRHLIDGINVALEHVEDFDTQLMLDRAKENLLQEVDIYIDYLSIKRIQL